MSTNLLNELKFDFLDSVARFKRSLYWLRFYEGLTMKELQLIESVVKTENLTLKVKKLAREYKTANALKRLVIHQELRYLKVSIVSFLCVVDELP